MFLISATSKTYYGTLMTNRPPLHYFFNNFIWELGFNHTLQSSHLLHISMEICLICENITGYLKNHWAKQRHVCTHFDAFPTLVPNMDMKYTISDLVLKMLRKCSVLTPLDIFPLICVARGEFLAIKILIILVT